MSASPLGMAHGNGAHIECWVLPKGTDKGFTLGGPHVTECDAFVTNLMHRINLMRIVNLFLGSDPNYRAIFI